MRETDTRPTITVADMLLADKGWEPGLREAYSSLLNWTAQQRLIVSDRYRLTRFIGRGGFGLVYAAFDLTEQTEVAIKFIHPGQTITPRQLRRIEREFDIAQQLQHPNLVRLHQLTDWQGIRILVMDFVPGQTVSDWIAAAGPQPWPVVAPLFHQLLDVLCLMHDRGIVHRDIKPSNLMITPAGRLTLLDLGLTRELDDPQKTSSSGELVGSPHYIPPELILGQTSTPAADLYQLGLVMHFMLTGRHPFSDGDEHTHQVLSRQLTRPLSLVKTADLPAKLRLNLNQCLDKDPARRPQDASALRRLMSRSMPMTWLHHRLRLRWPFRFTLAGLSVMVLTSLLYLWFTLPANRVLQSDQALIARNALGRECWRQEPGPDELLAGWIEGKDETGHNTLSAIYTTDDAAYQVKLPDIKPRQLPITRRNWRISSGRKVLDLDLTLGMDFHDFFPFCQLSDIEKRDLDGDGQAELTMIMVQAGTMFPTQLFVLSPNRTPLFTLSTPGRLMLDRNGIMPAGFVSAPQEYGFLVAVNPFCHYCAWIWNIENPSQTIPPSFTETDRSLKTDNIVLLPPGVRPDRLGWPQSQTIRFQDTAQASRIDVHRDGRIELNRDQKRLSFRDPPDILSAAFVGLNLAYYRLCRDQLPLAETAFEGIDPAEIQNPWLRSTLAWYRGETALRQGRYTSARASFQDALRHDPDNLDALNRLCEVAVLETGPAEGLSFLEDQAQVSTQFWGLGIQGRDLFRLSCLLMAGSLNQTEDIVGRISRESIQAETCIKALGMLYQENRDHLPAVLNLLHSPIPHNSSPLDISELQIILCRLWLVGNQWQKAEPLLRRYATQTILHKPFVETSLAWCEAQAGTLPAAYERAERAFALMRRMAKGQFWARYWLFYDAYAYGRTMDLLGRPDKAAVGYRLCAELAPFSFLAKEARQRLPGSQRLETP